MDSSPLEGIEWLAGFVYLRGILPISGKHLVGEQRAGRGLRAFRLGLHKPRDSVRLEFCTGRPRLLTSLLHPGEG